MTEEEIQRSQRLMTMLNDPAFAEVVRELVTENNDDWAREKDPARREELWHEQAALTRLVMKMTGIAQRPEFEAKKKKKTELAQKP